MALVRETGSGSNIRETGFWIPQLAARGQHAQAVNALAQRLAIELAEDAGQMHGMHASFFGKGVQRYFPATSWSARSNRSGSEGFDIRKFHDPVLLFGAVRLDVLERNLDAWIATKKASSA